MEGAQLWQGKIGVGNGTVLQDIRLETHDLPLRSSSLHGDYLDFLSFVDPTQIPLHLVQGPSLQVVTDNVGSRTWLQRVLVDEEPLKSDDNVKEGEGSRLTPWHLTHASQSTIAVLARPTSLQSAQDDLSRITEVLLYAERIPSVAARLPTPPHSSDNGKQLQSEQPPTSGQSEISFRCLFLSSDVLYKPLRTTKSSRQAHEAQFIEHTSAAKKRLSDLFDEASDQRKKARHHSGHSISIAASRASDTPQTPQAGVFDNHQIKQEPVEPSMAVLRTEGVQPNVIQPRRRPPQASQPTTPVPTSRPASSRAMIDRHRSALAKGNTAGDYEDMSIDAKNKQTVSRIVMAGMRLYGLQQRKTKSQSQHHQSFASQSPIRPNPGPADEAEQDAEQDAEYKGVYHQTYKGALFAFRDDARNVLLKPEAVQEVVDKLLSLFCSKPP